MTTNRLSAPNGGQQKSVFRALEWAIMCEDKGLHGRAKEWRDAHGEGWDEKNYCHVKAQEYREKIARGGK